MSFLQVLDHYTRSGLVDVRSLTLPGNQPNFPGLQHLYIERTGRRSKKIQQFDVVSLHDCLYRNMYRYSW